MLPAHWKSCGHEAAEELLDGDVRAGEVRELVNDLAQAGAIGGEFEFLEHDMACGEWR
jgi:hypothetical protein